MTRFFIILAGFSLIANCLYAQEDLGQKIVLGARNQVGKTIRYDPSYQILDYPNGDVEISGGVCTDVIIRALRDSIALDLQKAVHEDMVTHFSKYPKNWGLSKPDKNIDHRRVPNLQMYLKRQGFEVPVSENPNDYKAGDIVTCIVPPNLPHIMIVSDIFDDFGVPYVIHNIGSGTKEEYCLFQFQLTGHYRIRKVEQADAPNYHAFGTFVTDPADAGSAPKASGSR